MAGSRLEKIGNIYLRNSGLLQSGALKWEDRPLWYDVYTAFPPFDKPKFDRPVPNIKLKQIFYNEDKIRAIIHKTEPIDAISFTNSNYKSITQKYVDGLKNNTTGPDGDNFGQQLNLDVAEFLKHKNVANTRSKGKSTNVNIIDICK